MHAFTKPWKLSGAPASALPCRTHHGLCRRGEQSSAAAHQKRRSRSAVAAGLSFTSVLPWLRPSPVKEAREALIRELASPQPNTQRLNQLVDVLLDSSEPFNESIIGGGPWQVVYSRGPLLWRQWTSPGRLVGAGGNTASQEFLPQGRRVINRGQVAGEAVTVTAEGTYEPQDDSPRLPKLLKASITSGEINWGGRRIPLPIRGSGLVYLAYADSGGLRVFRGTNGSVTVQIREDRLGSLLGRQ